MTSSSQSTAHVRDASLSGVSVLPLLRGPDGDVIIPLGPLPKRSNRTVSVSLCPRRNRLRISFQACGVTYEGRPGTEDPLEAAEIGAALRDTIEARLVATGFNEVRMTIQHVRAGRNAISTGRSDAQLLLYVASALALSAPRAVAEATKIDRVRPAWSVRPAGLAVQRAVR